jgi:hypothetical protein
MSVPRYIALAFALLLCSCGEDSPKIAPPAAPPPASGPALEGSAGARAAVDAYFAAARKPDEEAMLALGTAEWREKEKTGNRTFTPVIAQGKARLKSAEIREPVVTGDTAKVSVRAVFTGQNGRDDNEGMNFTLVRKDGRWWITDLR